MGLQRRLRLKYQLEGGVRLVRRGPILLSLLPPPAGVESRRLLSPFLPSLYLPARPVEGGIRLERGLILLEREAPPPLSLPQPLLLRVLLRLLLLPPLRCLPSHNC